MEWLYCWRDFCILRAVIVLILLLPQIIINMRSLLLLALAISTLVASCGSEPSDTSVQEQIDSIVKARTSIIEQQLRRNNDSIINALAEARANAALGEKAPQPKDTAATP
jgi:hypothetical protein